MIIEAHLTYRCTLACLNCNRACHLNQRHTPDLTIEQFREALKPVQGIERIVLIGGEPTLHPDVVEFGRIALGFAPKVLIYSNAFTADARDKIEQLAAIGILNSGGTEKLGGSIVHATNPFIAPIDFGVRDRGGCNWWSKMSCGYSLDACGWSPCAIGGAIDGILRLGVRTWAWSMVDAPERIATLCRHCGAFWTGAPEDIHARLQTVKGQPMSATWAAALLSSKV